MPPVVEIWRAHTTARGRAALLGVLAHSVGCRPEDVRLDTGPHGKPRLAAGVSPRDLRFNLSHAGHDVIIAVTEGREVGIDVQPDEPDHHGLEHFFTRSEQAVLAELPAGPSRRRVVAQLWAGKEAILKATGRGVSRAIRDLDVAPLARGETMTLERTAAGDPAIRSWIVQALPTALLPYPGALAVEGDQPPALVLRNWPADVDV